jgi:serine/threonine-protein kinase
MREARAAAAIDSPHVARVLDFGRTKRGEPFLVLEHLEGTDLAHLQQRPEVEQAVGWILQACVGLAAAHGRGIIHRDLKPSNLFLARQPDGSAIIKLLDFGLAKSYERDDGRVTATGAVLGSPSYMSPEQLGGKPLDVRSDVWGLGVTLFELLTGELPFQGPTTPAIWTAVMTAPPITPRSLRPDLPEDLEAVLLSCLSKDPAGRPSDVAALAAQLELVVPAHAGVASRARHVLATASTPKVITDASLEPVVPTHLVSSMDTTQERRNRVPVLIGLGAVALTGVVVLVLVLARPKPPLAEPAPAIHREPAPIDTIEVAVPTNTLPSSGASTAAPTPATHTQRFVPHGHATAPPTGSARKRDDPLGRF